MKKLNIFLIAITLLTACTWLSSCTKDIDPLSGDTALANEQNATEEYKISVSELENNVSIEGATKLTGTAPVPTGTLDFQIASTEQAAFQNNGFTIQFESTGDVAGAYIQLLDVDGNKIDGYFDVPVDAFSSGRLGNINKGNNILNGKTTSEDEFEIDVNFTSSIPAGQFCYEICIYDEQNNIAQIVEVCVEVEAWGGNASLIGKWAIDRYEPVYLDEYKVTLNCTNGQSLEVDEYLYIKDPIFNLEFKSNGDYINDQEESYRNLNYTASTNQCAAVYYDDVDQYKVRHEGKWAFNEDTEALTAIAFSFQDFISPNYSEVYPDGEVDIFELKAEVINGELVISFEAEDNDGNLIDAKAIFKRI